MLKNPAVNRKSDEILGDREQKQKKNKSSNFGAVIEYARAVLDQCSGSARFMLGQCSIMLGQCSIMLGQRSIMLGQCSIMLGQCSIMRAQYSTVRFAQAGEINNFSSDLRILADFAARR